MADLDLRADLRWAVHQLRRKTKRGRFPASLHLGILPSRSPDPGPEPAEQRVDWPLDGEPLDVGLRAQICAALLARAVQFTPRPAAWIVRDGHPEPHDLDLAWAPVLARVFAESDIVPRCVVVMTRFGWYEPLGDDGAEWKRLRVLPRVDEASP